MVYVCYIYLSTYIAILYLQFSMIFQVKAIFVLFFQVTKLTHMVEVLIILKISH